ncbi:hypothetical protein [Sporosarcina sp. 6E9]|uniref:hypothetical protein n=1 Tax=Sporosarcina sp. 6E9 TaxID=2819235 RepID=UPI001B315B92|nr:hypothetical protein [Sporosarcina sp. 6E9]
MEETVGKNLTSPSFVSSTSGPIKVAEKQFIFYDETKKTKIVSIVLSEEVEI